MHHDRIGVDRLLIPDPLIDLIGAEHPARIFHQEQQDLELYRRQLDRIAIDCDLHGVLIEL